MDFLRYLQNSHTYHFSLDTLTRMAASQGLKRVFGDEIVRASFKAMTPAEAAAVKNYTKGDQTYQEIEAYLRRIEKWRSLLPVAPYKALSAVRRVKKMFRKVELPRS